MNRIMCPGLFTHLSGSYWMISGRTEHVRQAERGQEYGLHRAARSNGAPLIATTQCEPPNGAPEQHQHYQQLNFPAHTST